MMSTRWNTSDVPDGDATHARLGNQLHTRLHDLRDGILRFLASEWVEDYRPGCLFMTVVDDTHTDERTLGMATALELVHQYVALRRQLFSGHSEATTTDLLLAGDVLLAEAFETVEEYAGPDGDGEYRRLVETTLGVTTAPASDGRNPVVSLYVAAARFGGSVAEYDEPTQNTLGDVGRAIGRRVVGKPPEIPVAERIDSLHDPLRNRLDEFVATFLDSGDKQ